MAFGFFKGCPLHVYIRSRILIRKVNERKNDLPLNTNLKSSIVSGKAKYCKEVSVVSIHPQNRQRAIYTAMKRLTEFSTQICPAPRTGATVSASFAESSPKKTDNPNPGGIPDSQTKKQPPCYAIPSLVPIHFTSNSSHHLLNTTQAPTTCNPITKPTTFPLPFTLLAAATTSAVPHLAFAVVGKLSPSATIVVQKPACWITVVVG